MGGALRKYDYYKEPEGKDPVGKVVGLGKHALLVSAVLGGADIIMHETNPTFLNILNRAAFWTLPVLGMSFAFSAVTFLATNVRGKDDMQNYFLGAGASCLTMHTWTRQKYVTIASLPIFLFVAAVVKTSADYKLDERLIETDPEYPPVRKMQLLWDFDFDGGKEVRPWKQQGKS